jgi:hypothetical protein
MGWVMMSRQDLQRVEVLTEVLAGRRTTVSAAGVLGVSLRPSACWPARRFSRRKDELPLRH